MSDRAKRTAECQNQIDERARLAAKRHLDATRKIQTVPEQEEAIQRMEAQVRAIDKTLTSGGRIRYTAPPYPRVTPLPPGVDLTAPGEPPF